MKILICEDEEILMSAIELRLRKRGFELKLVDHSSMIKDVILQNPPDLVVVDLEMENFSSLTLIKDLRQKLENDIPIIVLGELNNEQALLEAMHAGANDFITKPFRPTELVLRIQNIFAKRKLLSL